MNPKKQVITISRYSDSVARFSPACSGGLHHICIRIPNDSVHISNDGDGVTIRAKWDKTRYHMPKIEQTGS